MVPNGGVVVPFVDDGSVCCDEVVDWSWLGNWLAGVVAM